MENISTPILLMLLVFLILTSSFFSAAETSITSINRYKLQHNASKKNAAAIRIITLLKKPDLILSTILIGNTFSNILASTIATILALRLSSEYSLIVVPIVLTTVVLIFSEVAPKTFATLYPEKIAYPASKILCVILKLFYPLVIFTTTLSNFILQMFGIHINKSVFTPLTNEELRGMLKTQTTKQNSTSSSKNMLVGVLNLEEITVNGCMIPRNEIEGIDITDDWKKVMKNIKRSKSNQIIVYKSTLDNALGIIELGTIIALLETGSLTKNTIARNLKSLQYIPEGTSLSKQLQNFQQYNYHLGLIVDEYGDTLGIIKLEDILEEITGKLYYQNDSQEFLDKQEDGSYKVCGSYPIRDLNRILNWELPTEGPTTISGLIIEILETIPDGLVCCSINGYRIEVLSYNDNKIAVARLYKPSQADKNEQGSA
jgi:Mg2+/Co2+ transporter CorB